MSSPDRTAGSPVSGRGTRHHELHVLTLKLALTALSLLNVTAMNTRSVITILITAVALCLSCKSTPKDEDVGAAGKPEEMADSTRLDSSYEARSQSGGVVDSTFDTIR
ncbi:MAG: hypothetical protein HY851_03365 [candidate division Zixibacteria bacterium]|nr:hypothetical protein [candidate division Zixibacteria bacterium]